MSDTARPKTGGDKLDAAEVNADLPIVVTGGETINGATLPVATFQDTADNEFYACDADDDTKLGFLGFIVSNTTNGNPATFQHHGVVSGFTGLSEGVRYYVQNDKTIGIAKGENEIFVGIAVSETQILIFKDPLRIISLGQNHDKTYFNYPMDLAIASWIAASCVLVSNGAYMDIQSNGATWSVQSFIAGTDSDNAGQFDGSKKFIITFRAKATNGVTGDRLMGFCKSGRFGFPYNTDDLSAIFALDGGTLYARTSNEDGAPTLTDISAGVTVTDWHLYRIEMDLGSNVKFYVDGVLKATHTTDLPATAADIYVGFGGQTNTEDTVISKPIIEMEL